MVYKPTNITGGPILLFMVYKPPPKKNIMAVIILMKYPIVTHYPII
jgi:hypothetical protein